MLRGWDDFGFVISVVRLPGHIRPTEKTPRRVMRFEEGVDVSPQAIVAIADLVEIGRALASLALSRLVEDLLRSFPTVLGH